MVAPHATAHCATIVSPRPNVSSRSRSSSPGIATGGTGGLVEPSSTSMRGWLAVPRTRTLNGPVAWMIALATSSDTPSSAHSARSVRSRRSQMSPTHRRASAAARGDDASVNSELSGTGTHFNGGGQSSGAMSTRGRRVQTSRSHQFLGSGERVRHETWTAFRSPGPRGRTMEVRRTTRDGTFDTRSNHDLDAGNAPQGGRDRFRVRRPVRHEGAAPRRRGRDGDRQDDPPPLPAAPLPGRDGHPVRGRDRPADPRDPQRPGQRQRHPR